MAEASDWERLETVIDELLATSSEQQLQAVPLTPEEIIREQLHESNCKNLFTKFNEGPNIPFKNTPEDVFVRRVEANDQSVVLSALRARVRYSAHYPVTTAYPGNRRIYTSLRRHF